MKGVSGNLQLDAIVRVIDESSNTVIWYSDLSASDYAVYGLDDYGSIIILATCNVTSGTSAFANVVPVDITLPAGNTGVWSGGDYGGNEGYHNVMEMVNINSLSNAFYFGDQSTKKKCYDSGTSNGANNRGVFPGGQTTQDTNDIQYINISTGGDAITFGYLTTSFAFPGACSNGTNNRGIVAGYNGIDYITISTTGNASNFGNLVINRRHGTMLDNGTNDRGVFAGGEDGGSFNSMDYITISTTSNAQDFGDLTTGSRWLTSCSNKTNNRGLFCMGSGAILDYISINSVGNASDFGDLAANATDAAATDNGVGNRGVFGWGAGYVVSNYKMHYINISSLGNSVDSGYNFSNQKYRSGACSNA